MNGLCDVFNVLVPFFLPSFLTVIVLSALEGFSSGFVEVTGAADFGAEESFACSSFSSDSFRLNSFSSSWRIP